MKNAILAIGYAVLATAGLIDSATSEPVALPLDSAVVWSSDNVAVATVSSVDSADATVTAVAAGVANLTGTSTVNGVTVTGTAVVTVIETPAGLALSITFGTPTVVAPVVAPVAAA